MSVEYREWKRNNGVKSGGWYWRFMVNGVDHHSRAAHPDNPKQKAKTKREAEFFESIAYQRAIQGIPIFEKPKAEKTFNEFVEEVYKPYSASEHRSHRQYLYFLSVLSAEFGDLPLNSISPFAIEQFKAAQQKKNLAGNTIRLFLMCGWDVFEKAIAEKLATDNPFRQVALPEINPRKKRRLSREEEAQLIAACFSMYGQGRREHLAAAIILMVDLGPRPSELLNLKMEDVNWDERIIRFTSYKTGKRKKSHQAKERWIPITDRAMVELQKFRALSKGERLYPHDSIKRSWDSVKDEAGVSDMWFRWLRDEAASRWAEAGATPYEIAYLLGHADVVQGFGSVTRMSMIYVKPLIERCRAVMEEASRGNLFCPKFAQKESDGFLRPPLSS